MAVRLAEEWFAICGGCEVTILDIGEKLLDILQNVEIVHMPVLMDHKLFGQLGEKSKIEIPEAEVGIVAGGVRNEEHKEILKEMRNKCKTLIALGSCACFGGIPALANMFNLEEVLKMVYKDTKTTDAVDKFPSENIPPLSDRVYAVDEIVKVDIYIPGCPTEPSLVEKALTALLEGKPFELPERSVCDDCPTQRQKKADIQLKRPLESVTDITKPVKESRCFMELGYLCLGPVTKSGCKGEGTAPRCISAYMPCRGCFGPIRKGANPLVEMVNALSSIGLDPKLIIDRAATIQRYIGAHGRLRPTKAAR